MTRSAQLRSIAAMLLLASAVGANAAASYCSVAGSPNAAGMKLSDVTFSGNTPTTSADDCYGLIAGQDVAPGSGNRAQNIIDLNLTWGTNWGYLAKDDVAGGSNVGSFGGITYTLDTGPAGTSGTWTLTATPLASLPVYVDFIVSLKSGTEFALWLFDDVKIDGTDSGAWTSVFKNDRLELQKLSHLMLFVREGQKPDDPTDPPVTIPEPGSLALAGLALLGVGALRRRKV